MVASAVHATSHPQAALGIASPQGHDELAGVVCPGGTHIKSRCLKPTQSRPQQLTGAPSMELEAAIDRADSFQTPTNQ